MKFDFTTEYDRRGMDALAVDGLGLIPGKSPDRPKKGFDVIPMWIADMSFPTVPTVIGNAKTIGTSDIRVLHAF